MPPKTWIGGIDAIPSQIQTALPLEVRGVPVRVEKRPESWQAANRAGRPAGVDAHVEVWVRMVEIHDCPIY